MDPETLSRTIGYHLRQHLLALARRRRGIRGIQKRDPRTVSERIKRVQDPAAYRPAIVHPASDAGEWSFGSLAHRRDGSRVLIRDRAMEHVPGESEEAPRKVSRSSDAGLANRRTRAVVVWPVREISGRHTPSDRASQLPRVCTLEREAESLHRRRFVTQNQRPVELLLRRRGGFSGGALTIRTVAVACGTFLFSYIIFSLYTISPPLR